jgi:polyhydroxyalkanoate synthesis repressor PhaR
MTQSQPAPTSSSSPQRTTKVIKRYANRKLYDTERSCYVTLEEISLMIKEGEDVRVVDNKTKDDLTAVTLAQIIVEEEKKVQKMPLKLLRSIIQSGNEAFSGFNVGKAAQHLKDDVERRVEALWRRDRPDRADKKPGDDIAGPAEATAPAAPSAPAAAPDDDEVRHNVVQEFVASTTEAFETWQKRVDERVKDAIGKMPGRSPSVDVDALKRRIEELETKLASLEARK